MAQFKVGDRVRFKEHPDAPKELYGLTGAIIGPGVLLGASRVDWDADSSRGPSSTYDDFLELIEPRKDSPRVGDTVRVVLEMVVRNVTPAAIVFTDCGGDEWGIDPSEDEWVKSVEIIAPAKPSVRDLPVHSALRVGPDVYVKVSENHWCVTGRQTMYSDAELDLEHSIQLVPKGAE